MADISRDDLATVIQEEYASTLLGTAVSTSAALRAFNRVSMGTKVANLPVLATIPEAGWVSETGTKPTAEATWANKVLTAEEIAVIIPVHENVVDDATVAVLDEITQQGGAAIGRALDDAILFGDSKPASWTDPDLLSAAITAGNTFVVGAQEDDLAGSIFQAAGAVEENGWDPDVVLVPRGLRYRLANLRNADGTPIFLPSLSTTPGAVDTIAGLTAEYVSGLVWDRVAEAIVVDSSRVILGVRQDISVKFLTEATVGSINLAERDMVALRFKARFAYVLGNTRTDEGANQAPVAAVLTGS